MITSYENTGSTTTATKKSLFASAAYVNLEQTQFYVAPMVESLNASFISCINSFLSSSGSSEVVKYCLFMAFLTLIFFAVWVPYLEELSKKIWRTKGMLNMIPMDIITKDKKLKQAFVSGDILQAVK